MIYAFAFHLVIVTVAIDAAWSCLKGIHNKFASPIFKQLKNTMHTHTPLSPSAKLLGLVWSEDMT